MVWIPGRDDGPDGEETKLLGEQRVAHKFDLAAFSLASSTACAAAIRRLGADKATVADAADSVVRFLYDHLVETGSDRRACVLVRAFKTVAASELSPELRAYASDRLDGRPLQPETRCLVLLATAGAVPEWNDPARSTGHRVIALPGADVVERSPMIAQLIHQLGFAIPDVVESDRSILVDSGEHSYNVFFVPEAEGSPYVPAQDSFVKPHNVHSVLGFGGVLPPGDLFAVILFSKVPIARDTAGLFRTLALSTKVALLAAADPGLPQMPA